MDQGGTSQGQFKDKQKQFLTNGEHNCSYCDKAFKHKSALNYHVNTHTKEKPCICDKCDKRFTDPPALYRHKLLSHNKRQLTCEICEKKFPTQLHLNKHKNIHTQIRVFYKCEICSTSVQNLKQHMQIHSAEKNHHCTYCPSNFKSRTELDGHVRVHTGEKPYKCQFCKLFNCII